jgi:hypothetical protein
MLARRYQKSPSSRIKKLNRDLWHRAQGGEDDVLEAAVLLHSGLELVECDLTVPVRVHLVENISSSFPGSVMSPRRQSSGNAWEHHQQQLQLSFVISVSD